jgi:hypothetical protein
MLMTNSKSHRVNAYSGGLLVRAWALPECLRYLSIWAWLGSGTPPRSKERIIETDRLSVTNPPELRLDIENNPKTKIEINWQSEITVTDTDIELKPATHMR